VRIVELLLDFGADPTMETYKKHSPLRVRPILRCRFPFSIGASVGRYVS
jgi:hypothetical protein